MSKYPRLSHKEVRDEIIKRTHQDRQVVMAIMAAHRDIIREALCNGIEVGIADLCTLTFQDYKPRPAGIYWDGFAKERHYFPNRQGYYALRVKPTVDMRQAIKAGTIYGEGATKEEWIEYVKKYKPGQDLHRWLQDVDCEEVDDEQQDE